MKLRNYIILFLFILSAVSLAQTPDDLMNNANNLYQKNQFTDALKIYKGLVDDGYESSSLYYNLGNTYYRTGELGYAIYYYEKALKLSPGDEDIIHNIKVANSRTVDKIIEVPKIFITRWWNALVASLSVSGWSVILLFVFILFLIYLGLYFRSKRISIQRLAFYSGSTSLVFLIFVAFVWFARVNLEKTNNYGVLLDKSATVKVSPDYQSNDAFVIHEGIKFTLEERLNGWFKIRLADGKLGWLPQNSVGKI